MCQNCQNCDEQGLPQFLLKAYLTCRNVTSPPAYQRSSTISFIIHDLTCVSSQSSTIFRTWFGSFLSLYFSFPWESQRIHWTQIHTQRHQTGTTNTATLAVQIYFGHTHTTHKPRSTPLPAPPTHTQQHTYTQQPHLLQLHLGAQSKQWSLTQADAQWIAAPWLLSSLTQPELN